MPSSPSPFDSPWLLKDKLTHRGRHYQFPQHLLDSLRDPLPRNVANQVNHSSVTLLSQRLHVSQVLRAQDGDALRVVQGWGDMMKSVLYEQWR